MKRVITLTLAVLLLLTMASCGKKEAEPTTVPTTEPTTVPTTEATEPAPTEPEWEPGISRAGYGEAVYTTLASGTEVNVIGQFKDYYVIEGEEVDLLVEKRFVRLDSEEPFESWNGYAKSGAKVFDNVYLRGEPIAELKKNTKVTVLEGQGDWLYIEWEGGKGYVAVDQISKWYINNPAPSDGDSGGSSSGGSSGGAKDGTDVPIGSLSAWDFDAELILLGTYYGPEMEEKFEGGMGKILAEDTEAYICLLIRDDEAKVTEYDEETVTIWLEEERYAELPRWLLRLDGDEEYESWTGYSRWNGVIYEEYQMRNELKKLSTNKQVTVLDELPDCYVVEYEGEIGYMEFDKVSEKKIVTYSGGSGDEGGGGGSSGGGGGSGATWTPPLK